MKADPQCPQQSLAVPAGDHSTSWYMLEYAHNQARWLEDFVSVFDKMMSNGYSSLPAGGDQSENISCSCQTCHYSQCWEEGNLSNQQFFIESQLDGRVVEESGAGAVMKRREETSPHQRWRVATLDNISGQLVNVATGKLLSIDGLSHFTAGLEVDSQGFSTIRAVGGIIFDEADNLVALDRSWSAEEGVNVGLWGEHGAANQRFKLLPIEQ